MTFYDMVSKVESAFKSHFETSSITKDEVTIENVYFGYSAKDVTSNCLVLSNENLETRHYIGCEEQVIGFTIDCIFTNAIHSEFFATNVKEELKVLQFDNLKGYDVELVGKTLKYDTNLYVKQIKFKIKE